MSKRAFVFAGQGAQFVGMGKDLAAAHPECAALYERANAVLGFDLRSICFEGPEAALTRSNCCQPAIYVTSAACLTALRAAGETWEPAAVAGLSLGEWTALYSAGVIDFDDGLRALEARGRFMQAACEAQPGGMLSVMGLGMDALETVCASTGVTMANINSDQQVVLSGSASAIADAERLANAAGAMRTVALNVAGAFHSSLMMPARERLADVLDGVTFHPPRIPVLANVTGEPHADDPAAIRAAMLRQVTDSVRWLDCVRWMTDHDIGAFVELGPGKVLGGLIRRIDKSAASYNVQDVDSLDKTRAALGGETA